MKVFTCRDQFNDIMTCIYDAWETALKDGHDTIRLAKEPIYQHSLFDEYTHVEPDEEKVDKVVRSIQNRIGYDAYISVFYGTLSQDEDSIQAIYNYLRVGFAAGRTVNEMYTNPHVMRMTEIRRRVGNEGHYFREFARFTSLDNKVYICHLEPKNNVILLVANHFEDRMPSEHWMIIDDTRKTAVVHPRDGESYLKYLNDSEFEVLCKSEEYEDKFTDMWRGFFDAISIKERENRDCQRNHMPIWMRKHAVEFK